jgi:hypothetical protein
MVTRYDLEFYAIGAPAPFQTNPLGKPAPNASGVVRIDLSTVFAGFPTGTTYEARVAAVGPGGVSRSGVSNQFAFSNPCAATLSPTSTSIGSPAGTGTVAVATGAGCNWTAASNAAWITLTSGLSGSGNGSVNYSVAANALTSARTGSVTIAGQTFSITQAGGCSFSISPNSLSITSAVRTGTVAVSTGPGCAWTTSSGAPWITITSGAAGIGNGTTAYSIAANTTITPRTGIVTIAGQAFTVTQAGIPCTSTISPTGVSVDSAAATGNIAVSIPAGCSWTAVDDASWVSITSGANGSGDGSAAYSIAANPNTTQRTATITVAGQSFGITQAGVVCTTTISPTASTPTHAGGSGTVAVTANAASCGWTASSNSPWITVTSAGSGSGSGTVSYNVAANAATTTRTGTVTIANQTLTVTQAGAPCTYSVSPSVASVGPAASSNTISVTTPAGCAWSASEAAAWISITNGASGSGNGTVTYAVTANPGITVRSSDVTVAGQTIAVTQLGQPCTYTLAPAGASVGAAAATGSVSVTALGGCTWTASSSAGWVTVTGGSSGNGNGTVSYSVAANQTTAPRTGSLTIGGQSFSITQAGGSCSYTASPASESFGAAGGPGTVTVTAQGGCSWTGTTTTPWISISGAGTGTGNGSFDYQVAANPVATSRSGTVTVGSQVVTINQGPATCTYTLSPTTVSVTSVASSGAFSVAAASGCTWTAASNAGWLTVAGPGSGTGNATIDYDIAANAGGVSRIATITVAGATFTVTQAPPPCTFTLSTTSLSMLAPASTGTVAVTAGGSCAWTAASAASWITVSGGASGSGNGTVSLAIAANTAAASRTGTVTIAGQTVNVTQQGVACTTTISPSSVSAPEGVTSNTVTVAAPAGCGWTAASNVAWITIDSGASGSGPGTVGYTIASNPGTTVRAGTMTIGGQTFNVSQSGRSCAVAFNPASMSIAAAGGANTVDVTTGSGCTWNAMPSTAWITITSGGSGAGVGTIGFSVSANTSTFVRTGTIAVGGALLQIAQTGTCSYLMSPLSVSGSAAATTTTVYVSAAAGCAWTAASNAAWLDITSGQTGTGSGTVTVAADPNNTTSARIGTATIAGQTFTFNQGACNYNVSPATVSIGSNGMSTNAFITAGASCAWSASSSASWITLPAATSGTGTAWLQYVVAPNPNTAPRSATITMAGRTLTVNQAAAPCTFTVTPLNVTTSKTGGTATITVSAAAGCAWTVQNSLLWVTTTSGQSGNGNGKVTLQIAPNPLPFPRAAGINIAGKLVIITQKDIIIPPAAPGNLRIVTNP